MAQISFTKNPVKPGSYRVVLHPGNRIGFDRFLQFAEQSSVISRVDAKAVLELAAEWVELQGGYGKEVDLGPLGRSKLGIKGSFEKEPKRLRPGDVEVSINWVLPRILKRGVRVKGSHLEFERIAVDPKTPQIKEIRPILPATDERPVAIGTYRPDEGLRLFGVQLDFDPADPEQGVFGRRPGAKKARRVDRVWSTGYKQIHVQMPGDISGPLELQVRRRHTRKTADLLFSMWERVEEV